jgi:dihydropteroate synthase/2-amino-4-hydroxy-6-hydroxymethyldihydropteridine diphosphokinase
MTNTNHTIYLAFGTNLGLRAANLRAALQGMAPSVRIRRVSSVYETEPWGYADQPAFYNQVIEAETALSPLDLLAFLKKTEIALGREVTFRNGPRLIDIDILFYDNQQIQLQELAIPHPGVASRAFVLVPLSELAPELVHPLTGTRVCDMLVQVDSSGVQRVMHKMPPFGTRTFVMGILNVTPDSFSGDGILQSADPVQAAVEQARGFVEAGVDILDVGGESTRPGSAPVSEEEELERVVPVVEALARNFNTLISVDTYKSAVADAALCAGADWVNDVWALRADSNMGAVIARHNAPVIWMHNRIKPATTELQERLGGRYVGVEYQDLIADIKSELMDSVGQAQGAGVPVEHIILDPGVGFGKTVEQNLELIDRLDEIGGLGYPVLLGPSRKSFIGYTLNLPPDQRLEGTAAAVVIGILRGTHIVRVHDVKFIVPLVRMTDAILHHQAYLPVG